MKQMLEISMPEMRFYTYHGVLPQEREMGGEYRLSLLLYIDTKDAHQALYHDDLAGTVNYAEVYDLVRCEMQRPTQLLEALAARIAHSLLRHFSLLRQVDVKVTKCMPPIAGFDGQGVSIAYSQRREMVVWDFDGTIADTAKGIVATMTATFERMSFPIPTPSAICATIGLPLLDSIAQLAHLPLDSEEVKQATELYRVLFEQTGTANVTLFEGIADEMLRQREAGIYVTIATSRGHQSVDELCRKLGIRHLIDYIVACEDVHTHKPDPIPVLHLCQVMNVLPSDTTVIGDTTYDIEMGRRAHAGCCIGVSWGNHTPEQLLTAGADKVVDNMNEH